MVERIILRLRLAHKRKELHAALLDAERGTKQYALIAAGLATYQKRCAMLEEKCAALELAGDELEWLVKSYCTEYAHKTAVNDWSAAKALGPAAQDGEGEKPNTKESTT